MRYIINIILNNIYSAGLRGSPFRASPLFAAGLFVLPAAGLTPHPQHGFKPNIFFLFFRVGPASLVSSRWVKPMQGRQRASLYGNRCLSSP